ncbi:MAG: FKBP-type peptidyl-prolyl cis-trans isomerase [Myxococcota bacterium]
MPKVAKFVAARVESGLAKERAASGKFLAKAAARPGAVTTESGLVYLETKAGSGPAPGPEDSVKVHYHGTRNDGSVFDSSRERGAPAVFSLQGVIPCWTEALQRMKVGGTATIACPAHLAYGDQGTNTIKAAAALQFEIELIGVE